MPQTENSVEETARQGERSSPILRFGEESGGISHLLNAT